MSTTNRELFYPKQTNTGLYCQLHDNGHSTAEILEVQRAYRVACQLFNGRFRKTERAFICHGVGAASAMAHFDRRIELINASMLHAAFDSGQFPDGRMGPTPVHRKWLRDQVGEATERLVRNYIELKFGRGEPEKLAAMSCPAEHLEALFMALTHEIDDMADGGFAFAPKYGHSIASRGAACAQLARQIGHENLAQTLEAHTRTYDTLDWATALEVDELEGYRIAPNMITYFRLQRDSWRGKAVRVF